VDTAAEVVTPFTQKIHKYFISKLVSFHDPVGIRFFDREIALSKVKKVIKLCRVWLVINDPSSDRAAHNDPAGIHD